MFYINTPYFGQNIFLTDWRYKRLENEVVYYYFTKNTFVDFRKVNLWAQILLFLLATFFSLAMHYLRHIFFNVQIILLHVLLPTVVMTFFTLGMGSVRIWSFYFVREDKFKCIWCLLDLKLIRCLSEWHALLLLWERNGTFDKETLLLLQGFEQKAMLP